MKIVRRFARFAVLALPLALSGCSYFIPTKRHLPVPISPPSVQTVSPGDLVKQLNARWEALNNLTAKVEIYATETKTAKGEATDLPSFRGQIVMRKPKMLRVAGFYGFVKIFDMASDGNQFMLLIPEKNTVYKGSNTVTEKSSNQLENLRPNFFLDAIAVRGLEPDDAFMVAGDTETVEDAAKKHLFIEPEYVLSVMRRKTDHENLPVRVITFHRDDMMPYSQDVYDKDGVLETQIFYSNYVQYSAGKYPSKVTIKRPQEDIQLVLDIESVQENVPLPETEFQVQIPDGTTVRNLK